MTISRLTRSTHQWLGLLIGIQVVLWISGGLVMSLLPIEKVRGEDWVTEDESRPIPTAAALLAVARVILQEEPLLEIRGRNLPQWRVEFADTRNTTVYVSPQTGQVAGRRNRIWRVYDFFWMLHIMDYGQRNDFNHPLLIISATVAWIMATSGIWLIILWLKRKRQRS